MATRGRKGSVLLPDTAGLNFGIWLDPAADVEKARPAVLPKTNPSDPESAETSLAMTMEEVRKNWEHTLGGRQQGRRRP
jgi:hypothetical protein